MLTLPSDALPDPVNEHLVLTRNWLGIKFFHVSSVMVSLDVFLSELPSPEFLVTTSPQARPFGVACEHAENAHRVDKPSQCRVCLCRS